MSRGKNKWFTITKMPMYKPAVWVMGGQMGSFKSTFTDRHEDSSFLAENEDRLCCWFVLETAASRICKEKCNCPCFVQAEVLTEMCVVKVCRINASSLFNNTAHFLKYILIHLDPNSSCFHCRACKYAPVQSHWISVSHLLEWKKKKVNFFSFPYFVPLAA